MQDFLAAAIWGAALEHTFCPLNNQEKRPMQMEGTSVSSNPANADHKSLPEPNRRGGELSQLCACRLIYSQNWTGALIDSIAGSIVPD